MELQNLVKLQVRTLDSQAEPIEMTVAAVEGCVSGEQVFKKVCEALGLKESSRKHFSLFEKRDHPTKRYRPKEDIPVSGADLYLGKWCFVSSAEKDMIHVDPGAAHLVFLQAQYDFQSGKFLMSEEVTQKLEDCLEPGFTAEDQYVLECQKQVNYNTLYLPQCRLLKEMVAPTGVLKNRSMVDVVVSKFGVKLVADTDTTVAFTWFEVSRWMLNNRERTLTLTWRPDEEAEPSDVPLCTSQVALLQAGVVEMIKILQKSDSPEASFHVDMISEGEDGSTVWENGLYNPSQARSIQYTL